MATEQELQRQIDETRGSLLSRTSPTAFAERLRNALELKYGGRNKELEAGRETARTNLKTARQSLTAGLSKDELANLDPAKQRLLVEQTRSGLESSIGRSLEESDRITGTIGEAVQSSAQLERDIQQNLVTRLDFLNNDLQAVKQKKAEFREMAFGLANTGVALTPDLDAQLTANLSRDEKALWLSANATALKRRAEDLAGRGTTNRNTAVVQRPDGSQVLVDMNTGEEIKNFGTSNTVDRFQAAGGRRVVKDDGGYDFFDPQGNPISVEQAAQLGGGTAADLLSGSSNAQDLAQLPLPKEVQAPVQTIANQFDGEPIVKNYNEVVNKYQSVSRIINGGVGGPGDLAVVYEFMKGLDPTSVVRESEYASAAKSGNIFRGAMARFNGYFKDKGGILPPEVKDSFRSILGSKLGVVSSQYQNVFNEYGRRIDKLTGRNDGTSYLTDYSGAFPTNPSAVNLSKYLIPSS